MRISSAGLRNIEQPGLRALPLTNDERSARVLAAHTSSARVLAASRNLNGHVAENAPSRAKICACDNWQRFRWRWSPCGLWPQNDASFATHCEEFHGRTPGSIFRTPTKAVPQNANLFDHNECQDAVRQAWKNPRLPCFIRRACKSCSTRLTANECEIGRALTKPTATGCAAESPRHSAMRGPSCGERASADLHPCTLTCALRLCSKAFHFHRRSHLAGDGSCSERLRANKNGVISEDSEAHRVDAATLSKHPRPKCNHDWASCLLPNLFGGGGACSPASKAPSRLRRPEPTAILPPCRKYS